MKKISIFKSILLTTAVFSGAVMAQSFKVGYVSLDRLMAESAPAKAARSTLDGTFKNRETALDQQAALIRTQQQAYEKDAPNLTEAKRVEREKTLTQSMETFEAGRAKFEEDLSSAQNKVLQDLLARANAVIKSIAEKDGYDYVTQEAVYIKPEYDLTQRVIAELK